MAVTLTVGVPRPGQAPLVFPSRCAGCGAAARTESKLAVTRFVIDKRTGEQEPVQFACHVPHCDRCARATKVTFLAQLLPFLAGFLAVGLTAFVAAWVAASRAGLDEVGHPDHTNSLVIAAAAGLAGGLLGGLVVEVAARVLLIPFFGAGLRHAPLLVGTFLSDADHVAGVTARPSQDATEVTLTFANEDVGREFAAANAVRVMAR
jgi:hypothetical protein